MLDRQRIERKDFTIRRRGYDPVEVDAHLAAIADQVEQLLRSPRSSRGTSAATASERVRAIVEAAETRSGEVSRGAAPDAGRGERPSEDSHAGPAVLGRLEAMQNELGALIESLRAGGSVAAGLDALETNLKEVRDAGTSRARIAPVAATPSAPSAQEPMNGLLAGEVEPQLGSEKVHGDALAPDLEGARLVALNMALDGSSREETERHLAEHFDLRDRRALVDEVYASVDE
jgi:DivIVA domain-containing protein